MKLALILLCCIVGIMAQSHQQQLDDARQHCIHIRGFRFKTAALCVAQKAGLLTANGDLDFQSIKQKLTVLVKDIKKVVPLVKKCAVKKATPKDTAISLFLCLAKEGVSYFLVHKF